MKVNVSDLILVKDDEITSYLKFSLKFNDSLIRDRMINTLLYKLELGALEFRNNQQARQELVKQSFYEDLILLLQQPSYDNKFLANLREIFSSKQLEEVRKTLTVLRDNINSAMRNFPHLIRYTSICCEG